MNCYNCFRCLLTKEKESNTQKKKERNKEKEARKIFRDLIYDLRSQDKAQELHCCSYSLIETIQ